MLSSELLVLISYLYLDSFILLLLYLPLPVNFPICDFLLSSCGLTLPPPPKRSFFRFWFEAGFVVLNSLSFRLSVKLLISASNVNESLAG